MLTLELTKDHVTEQINGLVAHHVLGGVRLDNEYWVSPKKASRPERMPDFCSDPQLFFDYLILRDLKAAYSSLPQLGFRVTLIRKSSGTHMLCCEGQTKGMALCRVLLLNAGVDILLPWEKQEEEPSRPKSPKMSDEDVVKNILEPIMKMLKPVVEMAERSAKTASWKPPIALGAEDISDGAQTDGSRTFIRKAAEMSNELGDSSFSMGYRVPPQLLAKLESDLCHHLARAYHMGVFDQQAALRAQGYVPLSTPVNESGRAVACTWVRDSEAK